MNKISGLCKDFIVTHIRSQMNILENVISNIEGSCNLEDEYIDESLKKVETNIKQLRKLSAA